MIGTTSSIFRMECKRLLGLLVSGFGERRKSISDTSQRSGISSRQFGGFGIIAYSYDHSEKAGKTVP